MHSMGRIKSTDHQGAWSERADIAPENAVVDTRDIVSRFFLPHFDLFELSREKHAEMAKLDACIVGFDWVQ